MSARVGMQPRQRTREYLLAAVVAVVTLLVYLPALRNGFVLWDDDVFILGNAHLRHLDWAFFRWAFTDIRASGNWMPVTWISYALDHALWGLRPAGFHLTNIVLHALNSGLIVLLAARLLDAAPSLDRREMPSGPGSFAPLIAGGVAGALFGLHPLHVEPAAWAADRRDVLCTFFYLSGILSYCIFASLAAEARKSRTGRIYRMLTAALFFLSLGSKAMAVTFPVVLLLVDGYLFGRIGSLRDSVGAIREKLPLFAASLVASVIAYAGQRSVGALSFMATVPTTERLLVAVRSVILYLGKMAVPGDLLAFYPYPDVVSLLTMEFLFPLILVFGITVAVLLSARKQPLWLFVWAYYVVTLLPVAGVVQVGEHVMADRYAYLPSVGPFFLVGSLAAGVWARAGSWGALRRPAKGISVMLVATVAFALARGTMKQIAIWHDSVSLWSHAVEKEPERIPGAYHNRAMAYKSRGEYRRALEDYGTALLLKPRSAGTLVNRGLLYTELGRFDLAWQDFDRAISLEPASADAYTGRGLLLAATGKPDLALEEYATAMRLAPRDATIRNNRGLAFQQRGDLDAAISEFDAAVGLDPLYAEAYTNRGIAREQAGDRKGAVEDYSAAIAANPAAAPAFNNRGLALALEGRFDDALSDLDRAIALNPALIEAYSNRGFVFEEAGLVDRALAEYSRSIELAPDDPLGYSYRGTLLGKKGRCTEAIRDHTRALLLRPGLVESLVGRGDCLRSRGEIAKAQRDYQAACRGGSIQGCQAISGLRQGSGR
ncbi:MAG: tetratricopeptide repeat protein [Nitrospiraceae bacterium]|nr:tetratricopeptide repeat protein [Nitrospiraceae bacterium]